MWLLDLWAARQIWKDIEAGKVSEYQWQTRPAQGGGCVGLLLAVVCFAVFLLSVGVIVEHFVSAFSR